MSEMNVFFTEKAWKEFCSLKPSDPLVKKIKDTIKDIQRGNNLGQEEHLKHEYSGFMSRHLDKKNRLIYKVENNTVQIVKCTHHYNDK